MSIGGRASAACPCACADTLSIRVASGAVRRACTNTTAANTATNPTTPAPITQGGTGCLGSAGRVSSTGSWPAGIKTSCGVRRGELGRLSSGAGIGMGIGASVGAPCAAAGIAGGAAAVLPNDETRGRKTCVSPNE